MNALQKKLLLAFALLLCLQTIASTIKYFAEISHQGHFGGDFIVFWRTAQLVFAGNYRAIYDIQQLTQVLGADAMTPDTYGPFVYPPHMLFLLWPLGNLSYNQAVIVWSLLPLAGFLAAFGALLKRSELYTNHYSGYFVAFACVTPFLTANLFTGQSSTLIALLFLLVFLWWERRPVLAGVCIGLIALKPQLGLLFPIALAATRQWRMMGAAALTVIATTSLATLVFGVAIWADYLNMSQQFGWYLQAGVSYFDKLALAPYLSLHGLEAAGISSMVAAVVQAMITLGMAMVTWRLFRQENAPQDLKFALLATAALLATPYAMTYDTPLLAAAIISLVGRFWRYGFGNLAEVGVLAAVLVMPFGQAFFLPWHIPFACLTTLALWVVLYRRYRVEKTGL